MSTNDQAPGLNGIAPPVPHMVTPTAGRTAGNETNGTPQPSQHKHIWLVTGPAGCGKSTVAKYLAAQFSFPYLEGDEFHEPVNIEKMAQGIPLTDADRWDWLILLREQSLAALEAGASGVVITCSALKRKYRDVFRIAAYNDPNVLVHFIYCRATEDLLLARVKARQGHYMKDSMVKSQISSLEEPKADERDVFCIDVSPPIAEVQNIALDIVKNTMSMDVGQSPSGGITDV